MIAVLEEKRSSQAETPRTPSVVARLMGLEVLPDHASSPTTPCQKSPPPVETQQQCGKKNKKKKLKGGCRRESVSPRQPLQRISCNVAGRYEVGSRSLPDTPRVSISARSWDSDPRLSLQLNKENTNRAMQDFSHLCEVSGDCSLPPSPSPSMAKSRKKDFGRHQDENKSPRSHYHTREIVKQAKESISSRRGGSSDEIAVRSRMTKPAEKNPQPSCSPPSIRFLEPSKCKPVEDLTPKSQQQPKFTCPRSPPPSLPSSNSFRTKDNVSAKSVKMGPSKCTKASYESFTERIKKQHPASETVGRPDALSSPSQPASMLRKHLEYEHLKPDEASKLGGGFRTL